MEIKLRKISKKYLDCEVEVSDSKVDLGVMDVWDCIQMKDHLKDILNELDDFILVNLTSGDV